MNTPAEILIVDDNEANRNVLNDMVLTLKHNASLAENGLTALNFLHTKPIDLVLLDIQMPEMDGYEALKNIKSDSNLRHIPVIMISANDEVDSVVRCIEYGADDYMNKPFNPILLKARIEASLNKKRLHDQEDSFRRKTEEYNLNLEKRVLEQVREITSGQMATIFAMAKLAESRDPETGEHLLRMREYCKLISKELRSTEKYAPRIDDEFIENIFFAAPLHDIGKVGIQDQILQKPGKLTNEEFDIMKRHALIGSTTLSEVYKQHSENSFVKVGIEIAESHHEKWDGSGYPHGLEGESIPLMGRITALGDVYDALTSKRCYKKEFSHDQSREIILKESGKHFDPELIQVFLSCEMQFVAIRDLYKDS